MIYYIHYLKNNSFNFYIVSAGDYTEKPLVLG